MMARAAGVEPKVVDMYHTMIDRGLVKNLIRLRAGTLCNSRNFQQGPTRCPVDQEVLTLQHVTGSGCRLTEQWRERVMHILGCQRRDILKELSDPKALRASKPLDVLMGLDAICKPLAAIQDQATRGLQRWVCPPIPEPEPPPRLTGTRHS